MLKKLSTKELVWYAIGVVIAIVGLVFLILGIVADNLPVDNPLNKAQAAFSWRYLGLIIFAVGALVFIITLLVNAKKVDRVVDRETRRKQRLSAMMSDIKKPEETLVVDEAGHVESEKPTVKTVDVEPAKDEIDISNIKTN